MTGEDQLRQYLEAERRAACPTPLAEARYSEAVAVREAHAAAEAYTEAIGDYLDVWRTPREAHRALAMAQEVRRIAREATTLRQVAHEARQQTQHLAGK